MHRFVSLLALSTTLLAACGDNGVNDDQALDSVATDAAQVEASSLAAPSEQWVVVTANPLATSAGAAILREGGTAIDAAIAVQAMLGLVEPQSSGLGGGAFLLYYDAQADKLQAYDGREVAPLSARPDMFLTEDGERLNFYDAVTSGLSVGVPGVVAMLDLVHREHGKLEWSSLFADAEEKARDGFEVSPRLHSLLGRTTRLIDTPAAAALYYTEEGEPVAEGTLLQNPAYAETLSAIAGSGAGAFYTGDIAEQIVAAVNEKAGEGTMTTEDLAAYEVQIREPVCAEIFSAEICTMPPPSSGLTMLQILALSEAAGLPESPSASIWPTYAEASRLAYADRGLYIGDPSAMGTDTIGTAGLVEGLLSAPYIDHRAGLIGAMAAESVEAGDPTTDGLADQLGQDSSADLPGTSHFSIRDRYGNIASMTTTVETAFGSHLMAGGFILNNQLTDFSFSPTDEDGNPVVNAVAAGKRPRSSMSPTVVFDETGAPRIAIGSPGGPAIIGYVAKSLMLHLAYDMPLQASVEAANVVVPGSSVFVEDSLDEAAVAALDSYGLEVIERELTSGLYGFALGRDGIEVAVDPRREGTAEVSN
ncbi:gamma-glutamyltranspeptidase [Parvularcula bermudensis HTCC2503]|uniref:Gamma-glutamyltranspeptidase n=1 Tax=Parvularcula bermudensis (strain ATCC BAA-594 / HTCC2503 / KCTC 12087) TaxID=314260 RepID=E0TH71_PARBH|nr:gamma-glutamyltransferase family protein [Parvularcula bermudensis]ADM09655.1 gamma-glutamyltranspeptidase [Parvularcula bermudensis HTCC2503]